MALKSLDKLIECFKIFPSVGSKTAYRYAMKILEMDDSRVQFFVETVLKAKKNIKKCHCCGNYSENEICEICENSHRDQQSICVVANPNDIISIEKLGIYQGLYHVLGGTISPISHQLVEDLNIEKLLERAKVGIQEIILALPQTIEGETTAFYLSKILPKEIKITQLASGLAMGTQLEYADELTLIKAINQRHLFREESPYKL